MVGISIFKTKSTLPEFYGRVFFDGKRMRCNGVTCIFKKYIEKGIVGTDNKKVFHKDGPFFINNLKDIIRLLFLYQSFFTNNI